jgi:hypothetical protein
LYSWFSVCVAVLAPKQARIIPTDVFANHASAGFSLVWILLMCYLDPEDFGDVFVVDAFSRPDAINREIRAFGAGINPQPKGSGSLGQMTHEVPNLVAGLLLRVITPNCSGL